MRDAIKLNGWIDEKLKLPGHMSQQCLDDNVNSCHAMVKIMPEEQELSLFPGIELVIG